MKGAPTGSVVPRLLGLAGAGLCVMAAVPSTALASRAPSQNERGAITRAAIATDGGPFLLIRVSDIRVSTAGPWATATVATYQSRYPKQPEMVAEESFYRIDGRWLDTNNANTPERNPSAAVQADLSLQPNTIGPAGGGLSTPAIIGIVAVGLLLVVSLVIAVVSRGGDGQVGGGTDTLPSRGSVSTEPMYSPPSPQSEDKRPICYPCHGLGTIPNPDFPHFGSERMICPACRGTGKQLF